MEYVGEPEGVIYYDISIGHCRGYKDARLVNLRISRRMLVAAGWQVQPGMPLSYVRCVKIVCLIGRFFNVNYDPYMLIIHI
jgi:hypothetical protein